MIIVSGLERSGTSLMMQILEDAGLPVAYDDSRKPDEHNPRGYYELSDGKIILELYNDEFKKENYVNKVIKITAFGLPMIEGTDYRVIYMERDIYEVIDSQRRMMKNCYLPWSEDLRILSKLNNETKEYLIENEIDHVIIDYNKLMDNPHDEIKKLSVFLDKDMTDSIRLIDKNLYRNRRN